MEQIINRDAVILQQVLNAMPGLIWLKDLNSRYLVCNKEFADFYGAKQTDIIGKTDFDLLDYDLAMLYKAEDQKVIELGETLKTEEWLEFKKSGRRIFVATSKAPHYDLQGKIIGVLGTSVDITEKKRNKLKLKQVNDDLKEAQRLTKVGSWHLDYEKNHCTWTDEVYHILELAPQSFKASIEEYHKYIHPDYRKGIVEQFNWSIAERKPFTNIYKIITLNQNVKYIEEHARFEYDDQGKFMGIHGTMQDITNEISTKKLLENHIQKLNLVLSSSQTIAYEYDFITKEMLFFPNEINNNHHQNNIKSIDDLIKYIHLEHRSVCQRKIDLVRSGKISSFECEVLVGSDSLGWRWNFASVNVLNKDEKHKVIRVFGVLRDISDKKRYETLEIEAQERERLRISKDIHDSIGQMLIGTRLMLKKSSSDGLSDQEKREINHEIDGMLNDVIRETRLIINNLGISLLEGDDLPFSFNSLIEKMGRVFQGEIDLVWEGSKSFMDMKLASNIFRIFQEALTNCIKYSSATHIKVQVKNVEIFSLTVEDNGIGFNPETIEYGFGILNMKERAQKIGAQLDISTNQGKGTEVSLVIA
ncbi:MAG: PAS domain-containing protein [Cyclobacteriaceae bacterium]